MIFHKSNFNVYAAVLMAVMIITACSTDKKLLLDKPLEYYIVFSQIDISINDDKVDIKMIMECNGEDSTHIEPKDVADKIASELTAIGNDIGVTPPITYFDNGKAEATISTDDFYHATKFIGGILNRLKSNSISSINRDIVFDMDFRHQDNNDCATLSFSRKLFNTNGRLNFQINTAGLKIVSKNDSSNIISIAHYDNLIRFLVNHAK